MLNSTKYSGIALQNPTAATVKVLLQLFDSNGILLKAVTVSFPASKRMTRDLVELFVGVVPGPGTSLKVTSAAPIPVMGLLGSDLPGTMDPVDPSQIP